MGFGCAVEESVRAYTVVFLAVYNFILMSSFAN